MGRGDLLLCGCRLLLRDSGLGLRWCGNRCFSFRLWHWRRFIRLHRCRFRLVGDRCWLGRRGLSRRDCRRRSLRNRLFRRCCICRYGFRGRLLSWFSLLFRRRALGRDRSFRLWFLRGLSNIRRRCCHFRCRGFRVLRRPYEFTHRITRRNRFAPGNSYRQRNTGTGRNCRRRNQGRFLGGKGDRRLSRRDRGPFRIPVGQGNLTRLRHRGGKRTGANANCRKQSYCRTGPGFKHE